MAQAHDLFVSQALVKKIRRLMAVAAVFCLSGQTQGSRFAAQTILPAPATISTASPQSHSAFALAAITYIFSVDKARPNISDSLIYTITVWNNPLQAADTLRKVEAEFLLPRFPNGNFALQLASFRNNSPYLFTVDAAQGKITWQLGDIVRRTPRSSQDTAHVNFSLLLADVSAFGLECGENPISAAARVSFLNDNGQRVYPGTELPAVSTLELAADFVAVSVANSQTTLQRGDTLARTYTYRNVGNIARDVRLCLQIPLGFEIDNLRVAPSGLAVLRLAPDSICVALGTIAAGASGVVTLFLPVAQNLPAEIDVLCLRGVLMTDCDREPSNNFYRQDCFQMQPLDLLAITKSASRARVEIGDTLIYTLRFTNVDSFVTAWNVSITDLLPRGVDLIAADTTYTLVNGVLTWRRVQLPPLQSGELRILVRVREDYFSTQASGLECLGASFENVATITSTAPDGSRSPESQSQLANNRSAVSVSLAPLEDLLEITQSVSAIPPAELARLLPGDTLLVVLNYGNRNARLGASNVTVIDSLPDARFAQLVLPPPAGFVYDATSHVLRRENFSLSPNESASASFRLVLRNDNALCTTLTLLNGARIFSATTDCRLDNNATSAGVTLPGQENLLELSTQAPVTVAPNSAFNLVLNYTNRSELTLSNVVVRESLPYPFIVQAINNNGVALTPNQIAWQIGTLPPRANGSVSLRAMVLDSAFCAPLASQNLAWISSEPRDCDTSDDTSRADITSLASPPEEQVRLLVREIQLSDANGDGCAEVGERIIARVRFVNVNQRNLTATQIRFLDPRVVAGPRAWPNTLLRITPASIAPNDSGLAEFEFVINENDFSADSLFFFGTITAQGFCEQSYENVLGFGVRFCPQPQVAITRVDINDDNGDRDGFAAEDETLNLIVVFQNTGPITADSVDATITISLPGYNVLRAAPASITTLPIQLRRRLAPGQSDSVLVQMRYANFSFSEQVIVLSAVLQLTALAGPQPPATDQIFIRRDCYARPNPFIPTHHPDGVRFAPNDGESVKIFDTQGNLVRALRSSEKWEGRDESGTLCKPGLYIWKIAGACEGTIVVVR